jgi:hypothetical protein
VIFLDLCILRFAFGPEALEMAAEFADGDESFGVAAERNLLLVPRQATFARNEMARSSSLSV